MLTNPKLLLDTNIFIRFFTGDDHEQQQACTALLKSIQLGKLRPYISNVILLECVFVFTKIYKLPKTQLKPLLQSILALRNLTILETTDTKTACQWQWQTGVKYTDCFIATQLKPDMILCTYDQEFKKLPQINCQTPAEVLQNLFSL